MPQISVDVPDEMPVRIAKFELEHELERKSRRVRSIQSSIKSLNLSEEDIAKFEEARESAWKERKEELL